MKYTPLCIQIAIIYLPVRRMPALLFWKNLFNPSSNNKGGSGGEHVLFDFSAFRPFVVEDFRLVDFFFSPFLSSGSGGGWATIPEGY